MDTNMGFIQPIRKNHIKIRLMVRKLIIQWIKSLWHKRNVLSLKIYIIKVYNYRISKSRIQIHGPYFEYFSMLSANTMSNDNDISEYGYIKWLIHMKDK